MPDRLTSLARAEFRGLPLRLAAALLCLRALAAQEAPAADLPAWPARGRFLHLTVEDGLSQNTVRATIQDRKGFLWFATEEGLNRFDGHDFAVFRHEPARADSLPSDMVTALCEDRSGELWVATLGGVGIFDRRTETFERRLSTQREVMAILEDRRGSLWIATSGEGLYRLDPGAASAAHYRRDGSDPFSLANDSVFALLEDRSGRLWVGTYGGGLNLFDPEKNRFVRYRHDSRDPASLGQDEIWSLAEDASGAIWAGTNGAGVSVLDASRGVFRHYRPRPGDTKGLRGNLATALYRDRADTMWVGTDQGAHRFVPEDGSFVVHTYDPDDRESLGRNSVRSTRTLRGTCGWAPSAVA